MEHPDPLDERALKRPLRPATVRHRLGQAHRFASALVHAGVEPGSITSLAALVDPAFAEQGLRWLLARQDNKSGPGLADMAVLLKILARHHVSCPPDYLRTIVTLAQRLAMPRTTGLTERNRERLRPFCEPEVLQELITLPFHLFEKMRGKPGRRAALDRELALAMALLLYCPVRRRNLAGLQLERNVRRMRDGRVFLVFEAGEVKNRRPLEFELPQVLIGMMEDHLATRSPWLGPAETPWLFARRHDGGAPIEPSHLQRRISARIRKATGLDMHVHLFRHLAAKIWLEANPGQYEALRRLLGHASLSATLSAYTGFEAGTATRVFGGLIDKARGGRT